MKHDLLKAAALGALVCASASVSAQDARDNALVEQLRRATSTFHSIDAAAAAGWDVALTGCVSNPDPAVGAMGYHYVNEDIFFDGTVDPLRPELLVYAPNAAGELKLVAVEYLVFTAANPTPPQLFGQTFHLNPAINGWVLHAWVWEHNPSGLFADFNPKVSCSS